MTIVGSAIKTSNMKKMQLKKISSNPPSIKEKPAILFYSNLIFKMQQKYSIQKTKKIACENCLHICQFLYWKRSTEVLEFVPNPIVIILK